MMEKTYIVFIVTFLHILQISNSTKPTPPIFIFGDSTADVGTNSFLPATKIRADFPPNGIDFFHSKPTGRFSNGFNSADFLSKLLGHNRSPQPYLFFFKKGFTTKMFRGVNFASAASGLLDVTGKDLALYNLGARKFGIISIPPIGCCPSQRIHNGTVGCLEIENTFARAFHSSLDALLKKLSFKLPDMKYALGNSYEMTINVIDHPQLFNFTSIDSACCGEGWLNAEKSCTSDANLCSNRDVYLFWDLNHPTQYASELAATTLYSGGQQFVTPINFSQLAAY